MSTDSEIVFEYLSTGTLPRPMSPEEWQALLVPFNERLRGDPEFQLRLARLAVATGPLYRWYVLVGDEAMHETMQLLVPDASVDWHDVTGDLLRLIEQSGASSTVSTRRDALRLLMRAFNKGARSSTELLQAVIKPIVAEMSSTAISRTLPVIRSVTMRTVLAEYHQHLAGASFLSLSSLPFPDQQISSGEPAEEAAEDRRGTVLIVPEAGLALVAAFLPAFFDFLGHRETKELLLRRERLPLLLHHLATGAQEAEEWRLAFPKLLCGMKLSETCETALTFEDREIEAVNVLLRDMLRHWEKLGSTSTNTLRETFLQREGRLAITAQAIRLTISRQTLDALLQYVRWNFRTIRLPWMKQDMLVDW